MKPIDYKYWFKFDFWTFEQAAYLICNINPDDKDHIKYINIEKIKNMHTNLYGSIHTYDKYFKLLKGTDFSKYGDKNARTGSASVAAILKLAEEKSLLVFPSRLKREWKKSSNNSTTPKAPTKAPTKATNHPTSSFEIFHDMEQLCYDDITISFLENDFIELSARGETKPFTYESLKLRDMRKKREITLNSAGLLLAKFLSKTPPKPDSTESKHKDRLKVLINSWFGLKGDPFQLVGTAPATSYEAIFSLKNQMNRASDRIKNRAFHKSIEDILETSNFDEENDAAGEFLKKIGKE